MNYYVYSIYIMKDISKVIEYLEIRLLHHVTIYFWWGDTNLTFA